MTTRRTVRLALTALAAGAGMALAGYGAVAAFAWQRYGRVSPPRPDERDDLLDRFMPTYDVVERHQISIAAPATIVLDAAQEQDLMESALIRAIFRAREIVLRARPDDRPQPRGLLAVTQSLGWGVLAEVPGREVVVGAVTRPWEANVVFRALPADQFASFARPEFVKIAWTLRADPVGPNESVFRTETRALATDRVAREKFRRYWALASPGIGMIRRLSLRPLRGDAERRFRDASMTGSPDRRSTHRAPAAAPRHADRP